MRKYVAPIVSGLIVMALAVLYAVFYFVILDGIEIEGVIKIVIASISGFVVIGVGIAIVSRIKELRGGQEDDISKY